MPLKSLFLCCAVLMLADSPALALPLEAQETRKEIREAKQAIKAEHEEMTANAAAARSEEKALREQFREALKEGDYVKAKALKAQLRALRAEHMDERKTDRQELKDDRKAWLEKKREWIKTHPEAAKENMKHRKKMRNKHKESEAQVE